MKTNEVARLLGVSDSTVKLWSREFADYLTPPAQGGYGRSRNFSELDARILAKIGELKSALTLAEDIHFTLSSMKAGDWAALPDLPTGSQDNGEQEAEEARLDLEHRRLLQEKVDNMGEQLARVEADRDRLHQELAQAKETIGELRAWLTNLRGVELDRNHLQANLAEVKESLARAEGRMSGLLQVEEERGHLQSELSRLKENLARMEERRAADFWLKVLAGVVVIAIAVTAVVTALAVSAGAAS